MKLLIDANIILDVLQRREPHYLDSSKIWKLCETEQITGVVSTLTFSNLVYVMRKELLPEQIHDILTRLRMIFCFADLTISDLIVAASMCWANFEDALQSVTAERIVADFIVTRNVKDFKGSKVMALTPSEFLFRW